MVVSKLCRIINFLMSKKDLVNPFQRNRLSSSQASSLLSYGDENFSMFNLLRKNSRLSQSSVTSSQKSIEDSIIWKYEKQFYEMDQDGRSLAEQSIDEKLQKQKPSTQDFWMKLPFPRKSGKANPFNKTGFKDEIETASHFTSSSFQTAKSINQKGNISDSRKSERRARCEEALKLKHFIEKKKPLQSTSNELQEKFSTLKMYKNKKNEKKKQQTAQFIEVPIPVDSPTKPPVKFEYPHSIYVRDVQYFKIPWE